MMTIFMRESLEKYGEQVGRRDVLVQFVKVGLGRQS